LPGAHYDRNPPAAEGWRIDCRTSLRRGLGFHIDDLNAAVNRVQRRIGILRLGLAVAHGHKVGAGDAVFLGQIFLDRIGAAFAEVLILGLAARRIGVTGNHEGGALQAGVRERLAEFLHRIHRFLADVGRVVVEVNFEIDLRLARGDLRDFLALTDRERTGLPIAQCVDEGRFLGLRGRVHLRAGRKTAGQRLRLQRTQDLIGRNGVAGKSPAVIDSAAPIVTIESP
jgi:hypothetical protein